ncbi:MAG: choice-of-anchor D domain-containing protein [Candidatus Acidiferrum sp.]
MRVLHTASSLLRSVTSLGSLFLISLLGIGCAGYTKTVVPNLSVSASSVNFQTVVVGQKVTKTFDISNTGTAPLQISALSVSSNVFSISGPSVPRTLPAASSVTYTLTFAPTSAGDASATVAISTNAASKPASISLAGSGKTAIANLVVNPTMVSFGNIALKSTGTQNVTLENTGDSNLSLRAVTVSGAGFGYSDLSPGFSLAPNQKVTFQVWFTPKAAGAASATLSLSSPDLSSPATLSLSGDGVSTSTPPTTSKTANLVVSPTVVSFGNIALKSTSTQSVTLENTGDSDLSLQGITVSGAGFGYSDLSPGFSLAPNQKVTFQVWFTPKVAGVASATLSLLSPNLSSPGTLSLSGDGVSASTPPTTNPAPPSTPPSVALNWNASTSQVIGYRIYRSETSGSSYNLLTGTAVAALTYTDITVSPGTTYYYVVTAVNSAGVESVYSNQVMAAVPAS